MMVMIEWSNDKDLPCVVSGDGYVFVTQCCAQDETLKFLVY